MRTTGERAVYRGREYEVTAPTATTLGLVVVDDIAGEFPDALERATGHKHYVRVPKQSLDRYFTRTVTAAWRGARITITGDHGDLVSFSYLGPPDFARAQGMDGDQYAGWSGTAEPAELSDVREETKELSL